MSRKSGFVLATSGALALLAFLLLTVGVGAANPESEAPEGLEPGKSRLPRTVALNGTPARPLVVALGADPPTLDPNLAFDTTSHAVLNQLMEGLFRHGADGSIEPAGAVSYAVSPDTRVYTVTLRSDAVWSDDITVTAQHYVDGIIRLLDPGTGAGSAYVMYPIEGAQDFNTGVITESDQVGVTALGTHTLGFTLEDAAGHFPSLMAMFTTYPVRLDIIAGDPDWTEAGHFVGNGPYLLTDWDHGNQLALVKNPDYHSVDQVTIEEVIFLVIPDTGDQLAAYEGDRLDVSGVPGPELPRILADPVLKAEHHRTPRPGIYHLGLNTQLTPTNVITVRKALASAIDRGTILSDVLSTPWQEAATSVIPPGIPGYQNGAVGYLFNPTQAQVYLTLAGYPGGSGFPGLELSSHYGTEAIIEAVAQHWRNNLSITVTTVYTGWGTYNGLLAGCKGDPGACTYNAYRMGWVMDYADANNVLNDAFHPDSPYQQTGWDNARYRQLMAMAITETNQSNRTAYFQEADRILVEDEAAVIPLYYYDRTVLVKSDVVFEYPPFGAPHFSKWRFTTLVTGTIDATGGAITSPDLDTAVEFPAGALADSATVTYTSLFLPLFPPTGTFAFAGTGFELAVTDLTSGQPITTFAEPLTVTIEYTELELNGQDENTLAFLYWSGSEWLDDGITIVERDLNGNRLVARIEHLTEFALFGEYSTYLPLVMRSYP